MRIATSARSSSNRLWITALCSLALLLAGARAASGQCVTNSECLWPVGCAYTGPSDVPVPIPPNFAIRGLVLVDRPGCTPVPPVAFLIDSFFDVFFDFSTNGGATWQSLHGDGHGLVQAAAPSAGNPKTFNTELLQLDITGGTLLPGMAIRESPSRPSPGAVQDLSLGGGQFRIDSFFDVFVELTMDGALTWMPANASTHITLGTPPPTAVRRSTWGDVKSFYR
jgi:hypothetical protein